MNRHHRTRPDEFNRSTHTYGDRAVRILVDVYESVLETRAGILPSTLDQCPVLWRLSGMKCA